MSRTTGTTRTARSPDLQLLGSAIQLNCVRPRVHHAFGISGSVVSLRIRPKVRMMWHMTRSGSLSQPRGVPTDHVHRALWRHIGTPAAIYGTIVYASVVAATSIGLKESSAAWQVLIFAVVSVIVFWVAHVFSTALGFQGDADRLRDRVRDSLRQALQESSGMPEAAVVPSAPLLLAALGLVTIDTAISVALWLAVVMLALLGYLVLSVRSRPWWARIAAALTSALFGILVILLKTALY
ncbi:hypothetical protein [Leifsonia sp. 71-9]|uniref:hypothetical protein n=1 Tax=Leifsonia sp. 71-9 TaxID=1895934 RepID=UPI0025C5E5E8|nr:hypothetical protein [Leifsonia sp. 71-9]